MTKRNASNILSTYKTNIVQGLDGSLTYVCYHNTMIVSNTDKAIVLDTGGYKSVTTKKKMNQASQQFGLGYSVYQKNHQWYVTWKGKDILFDYDTISLDK